MQFLVSESVTSQGLIFVCGWLLCMKKLYFVTFWLCWVLFDRFLWNAVYIDPLLIKLPRQLREKKSTHLWKTLISQLTLKEKQTPRKLQCACVLSCFSCVRLFATLWTETRQAPFFHGFSRQEYWSAWPCPPPEDLIDPAIEPESLVSPALAGGFFTTTAAWEARWFQHLPLK